MKGSLEVIDRDLRDLRARRTYLLDARTGPEDVSRAMELAWLDAQEQALIKSRPFAALLRAAR